MTLIVLNRKVCPELFSLSPLYCMCISSDGQRLRGSFHLTNSIQPSICFDTQTRMRLHRGARPKVSSGHGTSLLNTLTQNVINSATGVASVLQLGHFAFFARVNFPHHQSMTTLLNPVQFEGIICKFLYIRNFFLLQYYTKNSRIFL